MSARRIIPVVIIIAILVVATLVVFILLPPPEDTPREDDDAPEVILHSPGYGSILSGVVTINVSVVDEETIAPDLYIDGVYVTTANTYVWDTTTRPDGKHSVRAYANDSSGQRDTDSVQVTVENTVETLKPFGGNVNVMVYNIKESGLNDDWKTIVKNGNPEIIVFVETGFWDDDSNETLNGAVSEFNAYFVDENPYMGYTTQNVYYSTSGEAILSRFPIKEFIQVGIVPLDDDSTYDVTHDFIHAIVDINGTDIHVLGGHLKASGGEDNQWRRDRESEGIINYMDNLGDVPILYCSDQNSISPEDVGALAPQSGGELGYGPMTMLLDPENGTYGQFSPTVHNFTDVFRTLNPTDPGYTYGHRDLYISWRIDYLVVNSFFVDKLISSTYIDASPAHSASDHYAVTALIQFN